jgi:hypothetical protein
MVGVIYSERARTFATPDVRRFPRASGRTTWPSGGCSLSGENQRNPSSGPTLVGPKPFEGFGTSPRASAASSSWTDTGTCRWVRSWSLRSTIGGHTSNTPEHVITWLRSADEIHPGTDTPNLELTERQARDIAAYVFTVH